MAGASVGKASGRFPSLKYGFRRHGVTAEARDGALTTPLAPGPGAAGAGKLGLRLIFRGHNTKAATSGHAPPGPCLTCFSQGRSGRAVENEGSWFMGGGMPPAEAGRGCAGREGTSWHGRNRDM